MRPEETPLLDAESMAVLLIAYRARPRTVDELVPLLEKSSLARLDDSLVALDRAGFVTVTNGELSLESPYMAFIAIAAARMERLQSETTRTVTLMESLPLLIRNWDLGEARPGEDHPLVASVVHGREDRWPIWHRHLTEEKPKRPSWVLPDAAMLREMFAGNAESMVATLQQGGVRPRFIMRPDAIDDPRNQQLVEASRGVGVDVRVLDNLPGWFYVDSDTLAGLPVTWGESRPPSVLFIRTPPVIAALNVVFETLWARAEPVHAQAHGWEPVVRLLAQGMTDEAVGRYLGLDVRTVRRRVAEAMSDLGATSRFALGMAWKERS